MLFSPPQMHIPDGFLSILISVISWVITIVFIGIASQKVKLEESPQKIPLMGVMAAFIFAAQMINFPVAGGTSGHLLGGVLAAITLGPWAGMLVMASVIGVQALLFQDGGLIVMGANILNMGIVTTLIGFGLYRLAFSKPRWLRLSVAGLAAWLGVMAAAFLASIQLWLSGTSAAQLVFPAMLGVHALIGTGEGLITVGALRFIERTRPDVLTSDQITLHDEKAWIFGGILISVLVVLFAPFASIHPDGLERVAEDIGFINTANSGWIELLPDYSIPFIGQEGISTIVAGLIGIAVIFILVVFLANVLRRKAIVHDGD